MYNEILYLATLGVKPLGTHIRGAIMKKKPEAWVYRVSHNLCHINLAIYVVLPSIYLATNNARAHLRPSLAHLLPSIQSSLHGIIPPECTLLPTELCNSDALSYQTNILTHSYYYLYHSL